MYCRVGLCLSLLLVVGLGSLAFLPSSRSGSGTLTITVHKVFSGNDKVPTALKIQTGSQWQLLKRGTANRTVVFDNVDYWSGIVFRLLEGPHSRAVMMYLIPDVWIGKTKVYKLDNLNAAILTINWVKDAGEAKNGTAIENGDVTVPASVLRNSSR